MMTAADSPRQSFLRTAISRPLLIANGLLALAYFVVLAFWFPAGNIILFGLLVAGEVFHLWQVFGYLYTVWQMEYQAKFDTTYLPRVDVFVTVAGEPVTVVEETLRVIKALDYPDFQTILLNDGLVAKKDNWQEIEALAKRLKVKCVTRRQAGGAKAGNINNGLTETSAPLLAVFDADHVPDRQFLRKMVGYFIDPKMAFVQSPQYYRNHQDSALCGTAWEQQELFFGPLCKGKNRLNATFMCGTNMVIRRQALVEAGGMCETNIAEDFLTSLLIHERGWNSVYVPEVLAEGLAPEDFESYYKQQYRWTRGSLEVVFRFNPLFRRGLSLRQRFQYLYSASYFLSGPVVLMNALLPIVFFFTGAVPIVIATMTLAAVFLPYIFLTIYILQRSSNYSFTFRALAFALSAWPIQLRALWAVLRNEKTVFSVTKKGGARQKSHLRLILPHLAYLGLVLVGLTIALIREGLSASVISNAAWALLYVATFSSFIIAARTWHIRTAETTSPLTAERKP